jgi:hypothetical protein
MSRVFFYIGRFFIICLAYIIAVTAACGFLLFLLWGGLVRGDADLQTPLGVAAGLSLPVVSVFAARYAFFPMMLAVLVAEAGNRRSWLFHALAGMAVAVAAMAVRANSDSLGNPGSGIVIAAIAAGAVGGSVYWLIAGRSSGRMLDRLADDLTSRSSEES